jgi:hypothetical protein
MDESPYKVGLLSLLFYVEGQSSHSFLLLSAMGGNSKAALPRNQHLDLRLPRTVRNKFLGLYELLSLRCPV